MLKFLLKRNFKKEAGVVAQVIQVIRRLTQEAGRFEANLDHVM